MLFLTVSVANILQARYIGYFKISNANVKVMSADCVSDVRAYMKDKGYKDLTWQKPKGDLYVMKRVEQW